MKSCSILMSLLVIATTTVCFAWQKSTKPAAKAGSKDIYLCTKCHIGKEKGGKCPVCSGNLAKTKDFMCPKCGPTLQSDKAMNCPKCKTAMKPSKDLIAEHTQACPNCKTFIGKRASCPVCVKASKKKP